MKKMERVYLSIDSTSVSEGKFGTPNSIKTLIYILELQLSMRYRARKVE